MVAVKPDSRPLYLLVKDRLLEMIKKGTYPLDSKLPSEFELSKLFGVSRPTLREALRVLEEEGVLIRKHGIGTFVNSPKSTIKSGIEKLNSVTYDIESLNYRAGTKLIKFNYATPSEIVKEKLGLSNGEKVVQIKRIRTADGEPVVYCVDSIKASASFDLEDFKSLENSLLDLLKQKYSINISYAITEIVPVIADELLGEYLGKINKDPILLLEQVHYTKENSPVLYSENYFKSDRFKFQVIRKRV
ncbi:GntR family transcriptional regulator [Proteinivorax hydrogeniformans]|uniref:GntR family transcriptional regulator n=1 Tax=Proteinivorax hydrogeniformans TaxID=1826727 RepID=A0AAU8HNQ9_9FIRM